MGTLERIASAEVSKNLEHKEADCHVDVLGAIGMALIPPFHMAVFRLKYLNDKGSYREARDQFVYWTRKELIKKKMHKFSSSRLGTEILYAWLSDVCQTCNGLRYQKVEGSPMLSDRECSSCKGTGYRQLKGDKDRTQIVFDVMCKADRVVLYVSGKVHEKMGNK